MEKSIRIIRERYKVLSATVMDSLKKRGYEAYFCETAHEAVDTALSLIPKGSSVSWGGSVTLDEMGMIARLKQSKYHIIDRDEAESEEERISMMREAMMCDVYFSSINAISEDGIMVNIDGTGNRIASIAFGPKKVILIVGMNKMCRDAKSARERARTYAAPCNGMRLSLNLPCVKTGCCHDCNAGECMCSQIVEMRRNRVPGRIHVILVGENLGL